MSGITLEQAKRLAIGSTVYHTSKRNADGSAMRAKVTSVKTWKRTPSRVEIHVKHGLYDYATFDENDLDQITTIEPDYTGKPKPTKQPATLPPGYLPTARNTAPRIDPKSVLVADGQAVYARAWLVKFYVEYRLQCLDRLDAYTDLGIKSTDPRYDRLDSFVRDIAEYLCRLQDDNSSEYVIAENVLGK